MKNKSAIIPTRTSQLLYAHSDARPRTEASFILYFLYFNITPSLPASFRFFSSVPKNLYGTQFSSQVVLFIPSRSSSLSYPVVYYIAV